jgi:nitronate monooxygenase
MWKNTRLTEVLGVELPIVQGPFGGGNSTAELAAAVSNAGALGSLGAVGLSPDAIRSVVRDIAARTSKPFNINLWVPIAGQDDAQISPDARERSLRHIRPLLNQIGLSDPTPPEEVTFAAQVEALLEARPPVWSFVMGIPDAEMLREAKKRGICTIGTATTVEEAVAIEGAGADAVVASGSDSGGHRGSFLQPVEASLIGTMSLVPQVASAVSIPVIAAGGIADGRGIVAALALGAAGVQIGSAFLVAPESGAPQVHKEALGRPEARQTRLTRAITGRHARGIENPLMRALEAHPEDVLPYPMQHTLTAPLRRAAGAQGRADLLALWAGQNAASARPMAAAAIVELLVAETEAVLGNVRLRVE